MMEITYSKVTRSLIGTGGATRLSGEALIFEVGGKGTVFVLPIQHPSNTSLSRVYEYGILTTLGIRNGVGSLTEDDFAKLRNAKGRYPFRLYNTNRLPAFVSFGDESDPKSIFEIDPTQLGRYFSGSKFTGLDIEISNDPLTRKLKDRLPWLRNATDPNIFPRDSGVTRRPNSELPLSHMITPARFFGDGSR
ncbi:hypothetical protein [Rhizobium sp. BK491]|uniref:hypothetical protein n=1 Tax=Rhizobium sp. BK491 TaxID=2587009 RepID=UPI001AEF2080|nr:hypothetical protein [Rhizobium sp. BK491]